MKSGNLNFVEPSGPLQACNGTGLPFFFFETVQQLCIEFIPNTGTPKAEIVSPLKNDGQQRRLTDSVPNIIAVQM